MMKNILYLWLILVYSAISCNYKNKSSNAKEEFKINGNKQEIMKTEQTNAICPTLLNELKSFVMYHDSLIKSGSFNTKIIIVYLSQKDDECFITMSTSHYYDSQKTKGFIFLEDRIIAFYNPENDCNCGLVDINKLKKEVIKDYPDENSYIALHTTYEPIGRKYKIHSKDNLELVFSGYL